MSHIHHAIDYTSGAFVVHNGRVLLIWHYKLGVWLCPGGHIELSEDPEEAVFREIKEEVGLDINLVGNREQIDDPRSKALLAPRFIDKHPITNEHRHIGFFYLATPKIDALPLTGSRHQIVIGGEYAGKEKDHGWFTSEEVAALPNMWPATKHYAQVAIREVNNTVIGSLLQEYGFISGNPRRTDAEDAKMKDLEQQLDIYGCVPEWQPVNRKV